MKTYPSYKPSGVEWLGDVPKEWNIAPLKTNTYIKARVGWKGLTSDEFQDQAYAYLVTGSDFATTTIDWGKCYQIDRERYEDDPFIHLREGDLLITKDGTIGKLAIVGALDKPACLNSGIFVVRAMKDYQTDFLFWVLSSTVFSTFVNLRSYGSTINHLYQNVFQEFRFAIPPLTEQRAIAAFLDREVAKIDELIEEQRRLIALLAEKRQATISHAVTKGLDPNAKMKPSGIEWLGDIPERWDVVRFSRLVSIAEGQVDPKIEPYASMILLAPNHVESGTGRILSLETSADQGAESGKYLFEAGAVVYSKIRPALAKVALMHTAGLCSADMYPLASRGRITQSYLLWAMLTPGFTAWAVMESDRVAMPKINREKLNELTLPVPSLAEQEAICTYLEVETQKADTLNQTANEAIALLQERRSALISAAVTGKIDVRELAPSELEPA